MKPEDRKAEDHISVKPEDGVELPNLFEKEVSFKRGGLEACHSWSVVFIFFFFPIATGSA